MSNISTRYVDEASSLPLFFNHPLARRKSCPSSLPDPPSDRETRQLKIGFPCPSSSKPADAGSRTFGGLPALSALTLLLRKANELGDQDAASTISWWLFHVLLLLGQELHQRGIAYLLYPLYLELILPLYTRWKLDESAREMARMSMVLNLFAFVNKRRSCVGTISFKDRVRNMYQWLNYFRGDAPATAFEPMFRTSKTGPSQEYVSDRQQQRNLAWLTLIRIMATGRAPMVLHREYLDIDLDFSVLAGHRRENLLAIAGQMLAK